MVGLIRFKYDKKINITIERNSFFQKACQIPAVSDNQIVGEVNVDSQFLKKSFYIHVSVK